MKTATAHNPQARITECLSVNKVLKDTKADLVDYIADDISRDNLAAALEAAAKQLADHARRLRSA